MRFWNFHSGVKHRCRCPGKVNRTQSNSIELNSWIEFAWVGRSNKIELTEKEKINQTQTNVWFSNLWFGFCISRISYIFFIIIHLPRRQVLSVVFNFYLKFNADIYVPMPKFSPLWLVQCHCLPTLISCFETGLDSLTLVVRDAYTLCNQ